LAASAALLLLPGCFAAADTAAGAPPRADDPVIFAARTSSISAALALDLGDLQRQLEAEVPRQLWEIHQKDAQCVAPKTVDLALFKVKSPKIKCDIDGTVTRGRLQLTGRGRELVVTLPVSATVRASDIAGILKGKTATAAANLRIAVTLDMTRDWRLTGTPQVGYSWSREPGIDFLGQRITFTQQADRALAKVRGSIEKSLAAELAKVPLRDAAARGWKAGHVVLELNRDNPAVWARVTPQQVRFGGYQIEGRRLVAMLGIDAGVETRIGDQPAPPTPTALPPLAPLTAKPGEASLHLPIIADYRVLEPVIAKALAKRAKRPFVLGDLGTVTARFGKVTVYGTGQGRIAVGVEFKATSDLPLVAKAKGTIWLTARPVNAAGSRIVSFADVAITGETSLVTDKLLFGLANAPEFQGAITDALRQNFEGDFAKLMVKIDRAIAQRQDGPLSYRVRIVKVTTGVIAAYGAGLTMPVDIEAAITADTLRLGGQAL
jgi:hypothetical protein